MFSQDYILPKISGVLDELTKTRNVDVGIDNLLHAQLVDWACGMEDLRCMNHSLDLFEQWKANPKVNPLVTKTIISTKNKLKL